MAEWITNADAMLSESDSLKNAQLVANHFAGKWTPQAISALCGNMRHESSLNPLLYEFGYGHSLDRGFGLVQWTPATKLINWANASGMDWKDGDTQLARIDYEKSKGIQWITKSAWPLSFNEFAKSTASTDYLTQVFTWNYERPNSTAGKNSMPARQAFARKCFASLDFKGTGGGTGETPSEGGYQLAQFPMDVLRVTQGENSEFSHLDNFWAMDFVGTHIQYPYYAPVDCELIGRDDANAIMIWKSLKPVMCADGVVRNLCWRNIHDDNLLYDVGKRLDKGELMGHTGNSGQSSGDHYHLEVYEDTKYDVATREQTWRHIYDVFSITGVNVINDWGYTWINSDYIDGSNDGAIVLPKKQKQKDMVTLLLSGAIYGWKC